MFSDEVIKLLDDLGKRFGIAIDWSSENVVPYLKVLADKIVKLEIAESIMHIVLAFVFFGLAVGLAKFAKFCFKKHEEIGHWSSDWNLGGGFSYIGTGICTLTGVIMLFVNAWAIIECVIFPEKVIFDFVNGYIQTMSY